MIRVYYYYRSDKHWISAAQDFASVESASRFCWALKKKHMILDGWSCYDSEDNEEMQRLVNIAKINRWRFA